MIKQHKQTILLSLSAALIALAGCSDIKTEAKYPTGAQRDGLDGNDIYEDRPSILGEAGLFGSKKKSRTASGAGISVNLSLIHI